MHVLQGVFFFFFHSSFIVFVEVVMVFRSGLIE